MVGIFSWYGYKGTFESRIRKIKQVGFNATSLWMGKEEDGWEQHCNEYPQIVRDFGLFLEYAHAPYTNANLLWDQYLCIDSEIEYKKAIDYCAKHQIPILVFHLVQGKKISDVTEYGIKTLKVLVEYAKDSNVHLAAENTMQDQVLERTLAIITDKSFGLCFDSSHRNLERRNNYELLTNNQDRLMCIHLSDNLGISDDHYIPYTGSIDWSRFIEKFPQNYSGVFNLEVYPSSNEDEKEFLSKAYHSILRIEQQVIVMNK